FPWRACLVGAPTAIRHLRNRTKARRKRESNFLPHASLLRNFPEANNRKFLSPNLTARCGITRNRPRDGAPIPHPATQSKKYCTPWLSPRTFPKPRAFLDLS